MSSQKIIGIVRLGARGLACALLVLIVSGCAHKKAEITLENVAKNWCETIRASQIIAVYPLTEDLQPGDVFLVQLPIDKQQIAYKQKGFLPLDQLVYRIQPEGYAEFYKRSLGLGDNNELLPMYWLASGQKSPDWSTAPSAKFPTYTFSVRSGGGFNLAVPVQGVPIGLSLMGSDAAEGTITIGDSYTYGVDANSLYDQLQAWAWEKQKFLSSLAPDGGKQNYLRVISRVYVTTQLNVSLQSSDQIAAGVSAGVPKPIDLIVPKAGADQEATLKAYEKNIDALNAIIQTALTKTEGLLPGGTLKVASASAGSISLVETFRRPLVIGYVGFDAAIGAGGVLGPPFPTYAVLEGTIGPATAPETTSQLFSNAALHFTYKTLDELKEEGDKKAGDFVKRLDKAAASLLPDAYPCNVWAKKGPNGPLHILHKAGDSMGTGERTFNQITGFRGKLVESILAIEYAQQNPPMPIEGTSEEKEGISEDLKANQNELKAINEGLRGYSAMIRSATEHAIVPPQKER